MNCRGQNREADTGGPASCRDGRGGHRAGIAWTVGGLDGAVRPVATWEGGRGVVAAAWLRGRSHGQRWARAVSRTRPLASLTLHNVYYRRCMRRGARRGRPPRAPAAIASLPPPATMEPVPG